MADRIQTENFAAWNNVPYGTNENGLGGTDVKLEINSPLYIQHFQSIADLAKDGTFRYGGRTSEAKQLFTSGECAMLTESSGGLGDVVKSGINYGIGQLPYYEGHGPQNTIPAVHLCGSSQALATNNTRASQNSSTSSRKPKFRSSCTKNPAICL